MKIKNVIDYLEQLIPLGSQESYDNCGLLLGDENELISAVLVCLDCTEAVVEEAILNGSNLIIAHHPLIFKGLKKVTGKNATERIVSKCIKNDIAVYAIHTNLDHYRYGVNYKIGEVLGLKNIRALQSKEGTLLKLVIYTPLDALQNISDAVFANGGGTIGNYEKCQFQTKGIGSFQAMQGANPSVGKIGQIVVDEEIKVEYLVSKYLVNHVLAAVKKVHPYEEVAYEIVPISNKNQFESSGMLGELENEMSEMDFLNFVKTQFHCKTIRYTALLNKNIKTIAFCGGSGSFLLPNAIASKADVFITGDFKYHEFFDAENRILIADIGHYESEQFTSNLIADILKKNFTTFAVHLTGINTNPINYL